MVPELMTTLDTKVSAACDAIISGNVAATIATMSERYTKEHNDMLSGRRKLRVTYNNYATNGKRGGLYNLMDIQAIKLHGDNLEEFLRVWEATLQGLTEPRPESNLQHILAEQLRKSEQIL